LLELLLDARDSAVTMETAEALLELGEVDGFRLVASAWAKADEDQDNDLRDVLVGTCMQDSVHLERALGFVRSMGGSMDPDVRRGAARLQRLLEEPPYG
jgi:hypothetical protein